MNTEQNYQFRDRLNNVHKRGRRTNRRGCEAGETELSDSWVIRVSPRAGEVVEQAAEDLQDYLRTSMEIAVRLSRQSPAEATPEFCIDIGEKSDFPAFGDALADKGGYRVEIGRNRIVICGENDRGAAQACYYLEDLMNIAGGPFLKQGDITRKPLFSPRMVHSGWGLDNYPDAHLNAIAHAGLDAILIFVTGVNETTTGFLDFNDLVRRAGRYGIDVYFYSYLKSLKHPDDPGADEFYDKTYGALFKDCPGARGLILVGESCEFPSKDPNTTMKLRKQPTPDGFPDLKPSPGWWPCTDFPQWLECLKRNVFRYQPKADIVFWTYNWGWAPVEERLRLLRDLPKDISLQATFEMNERIPHGDVTHRTCDYTISFPGPGRYFASEAEEASRLGLRLYSMVNTGGLTWDIGVIPYVPVPQQWSRRHDAIRKAHREWGLRGLMESHHFGFYPSVVSDLAKWAFWDPSPEPEAVLGMLAERDFGPEGAEHALEAWRVWSDTIGADYACTNEDQYGPYRVGPSYPLIFQPNLSQTFASKTVKIPTSPYAHFGSDIVFTEYRQLDRDTQTAGMRRLLKEQEMTRRLLEKWEAGVAAMERASENAPEDRRESAERALNLGRFIRNCIVTTGNVKEWYRLNMKLQTAETAAEMNTILDELIAVAEAEIINARDTIPLVAADSRLGWEPSMEYMCDPSRLEWKIRQVRRVIDEELPDYRRAINS